ncbi:MAG: hypothetical protein P1V97_04595 [Planctomycetota bacterium]|nr:hypothetical protein [Planctomycetota bacterium]
MRLTASKKVFEKPCLRQNTLTSRPTDSSYKAPSLRSATPAVLKYFFALLGLLLLGGCEKSAELSQGQFTLSIRTLEQGPQVARHGRHVPIIVEFKNSSQKTINGQLKAFRGKQAGSALAKNNLFHERSVSIPPGRRLETVHYFVQDTDIGGEVVVIFDPDPKLRDTLPQPKPLYHKLALVSSGLTALTLSDGDDPRPLLSQTRFPSIEGLQSLRCASANLSYLPSAALSYNAYDVIVINDCDLSVVNGPKRDALRHWVQGGGWLIVAPGLQQGQLERSKLGELLPIEGDLDPATSQESLNALRSLVGGRNPGVSVVHHYRPSPRARVLCQTSTGYPLILTKDQGLGRVTVCSFPLTAPAINSWPSRRTLITRLLPGPITPPIQTTAAPPIDELLLNGSSALAPLSPPSIAWLGPLLLLYALFVAPLSFVVARRKRSPGLFFAISLGLIALTVILLLGLTWATKGSGSLTTRISIVELSSNKASGRWKNAQVHSQIGVFQSQAEILDIRPSPDAIATPLTRKSNKQDCRVLEDEDGFSNLKQVKLSTWSFRRFQEKRGAVFGPIEHKLTIDQDYIVGTITNKSGTDIEDTILIVKGQVAALGTLKKGQTQKIKAPLFPAKLNHKKTLQPFLDRLLQKIEPYHAYYPEVSFEKVPARERAFASFQRKALMLRDPTGELPALVVGFWNKDPSQFASRRSASIQLSKTIVTSALSLPCPSGRMKLVALPGFVDSRAVVECSRAFQTAHNLESSLQITGKGRLRYSFEVPIPPGKSFRPSKLFFEVLIVKDLTAEILKDNGVVVEAYDFVSGNYNKLNSSAEGSRLAVNPERYFDRRSGRTYLRIQNNTPETISIDGVYLHIAGQYEK